MTDRPDGEVCIDLALIDFHRFYLPVDLLQVGFGVVLTYLDVGLVFDRSVVRVPDSLFVGSVFSDLVQFFFVLQLRFLQADVRFELVFIQLNFVFIIDYADLLFIIAFGLCNLLIYVCREDLSVLAPKLAVL